MSVDDDTIKNIFFINEDEISKPVKDNNNNKHLDTCFNTVFSKMSTYILDENNNPVPEPDFVKYCEFMATSDKRQLGYDKIKEAYISTVFLGFDHGRDGEVPVLFETMVSGNTKIDSYQERYTSYDAALIGHARTVKRLKREFGK